MKYGKLASYQKSYSPVCFFPIHNSLEETEESVLP
jgi:hypothetical protein